MNNYVIPPFVLLNKVLDLIQNQMAYANVIAPDWPGQKSCQKLLTMLVDTPVKYPISNRTVLKEQGL